MRGGGGRGRRDEHQGDGGGGDEREGGGAEDEEVRVIVHRPLVLPAEEEEDDDEDLNDVVEVEAGAEEALVPILNLAPIDSLPPSSLLLLHGSSPQPCKVKKGRSICSEEGGCESQGGEKCVLAKMKQSWIEKGLPLKHPDTSIIRVISKVKERFKNLRKNEKTMGLEEKQRHSAALKSVTVNLAPANYEQAILSRWELPAVAKKSLIAVLDDYVGKEATRFDLH